VPKSHEAIPFGFRHPSIRTLQFKPIFDPLLKKLVRGLPSPVASALVRVNYSLARVKIWGRSTP